MYKGNFLDVLCPYCGSLPRHRIICSILQNYVHRLSEVLLFSPLNSMKIWFNKKEINWISALFNNTADIRIDIQHMPFEDFTFDFISCDHVLEHVVDWKISLSELYRIIKKGGVVEITVPLLPELSTTYESDIVISEEERISKFGQSDHMRIFGDDFINSVEEVGFDVSIFNGNSLNPRIVPLIAPAIYDSNEVFICINKGVSMFMLSNHVKMKGDIHE